VEKRDGRAVVLVRDQGIRVPKEKQERVFERFYGAHAGTRNDYGGWALGSTSVARS
jgi:two-component system, OmpR family, phosphate regulon sensor histidine kinase PhoR